MIYRYLAKTLAKNAEQQAGGELRLQQGKNLRERTA